MRDAFGRDAGEVQRRKVRLMWVAAVALLAAGIAGAFAIATAGGPWELVVAPAVVAGAAGGGLVRRAHAVDEGAVVIVVAHPLPITIALTVAAGLMIGGGLLAAGVRTSVSLVVGLAAGDGTRRLAATVLREPPPPSEERSFSIDLDAVDEAKYEAMRAQLPRGM